MVQCKAHVWIYKNGLLIEQGRNLVVDVGLEHIANRLGAVASPMSHMAIGDNGAASLSSSIALLGSEIERVALSGLVVASRTVTYSATFGAGISLTSTVREVGIFDAAAGGTMLSRFICTGFDLSPGEQAVVDWALTIGAT